MLHLLAHAGHTAFYQGFLRAASSDSFPTRDSVSHVPKLWPEITPFQSREQCIYNCLTEEKLHEKSVKEQTVRKSCLTWDSLFAHSVTPLGTVVPGTRWIALLMQAEFSLMVGHPSFTTCRSTPLLQKQQQLSGHLNMWLEQDREQADLLCPAITEKKLQ